MSKKLQTLGFIGLAAIAASCSNLVKINTSDNSEIYIGKANITYGGDSVLKYTGNFSLYKKRNGTGLVNTIITDEDIFLKEDAIKTPTRSDDSIFYAADKIWHKYDSIAKKQALDNFNDNARKATSRIYNAMDFVQK